MTSSIVILTAIESGFGFLLTCIILAVIMRRGRQAYHYLFAAFLLICAFWDLGTFLLMIRNQHLNELPVIGYIIGIPCGFLPVLLFHFSCEYTHRRLKWAIIAGWAISVIYLVLGLLGLYWKIDGVYSYPWGNVFKVVPGWLDYSVMVLWFVILVPACWFLFAAARKEPPGLQRRHYLYIATGMVVITLAVVKVGVVEGINIPILLPLGMFLVDCFNAIIGVAIVKDRLFDMTVVIRKSTTYSILAAIVIFVFSFSEHLLITYFGKLVGGHSEVIDLASIALGIAVMMPVKRRIEHGIDKYFARKVLEF